MFEALAFSGIEFMIAGLPDVFVQRDCAHTEISAREKSRLDVDDNFLHRQFPALLIALISILRKEIASSGISVGDSGSFS